MTEQSHDRNPEDDPIVDLDGHDERRLAGILGNPVLWEDPDPDSVDDIVAAIAAEMEASERGVRDEKASDGEVGDREASDREITQPGTVWTLDAARDRRAQSERRRSRWLQPALGAVAGASIAVLLLGVLPRIQTDSTASVGVELALDATDLAPGAAAEINVVEGRLGTRIDLDVSGLEPAPVGTYYEAWLRQGPDVGVSAGTFHLRGGDGKVELWAGVSPSDYPLFTITIQDEAAEESSGRVVLRGLLSSP